MLNRAKFLKLPEEILYREYEKAQKADHNFQEL